MVSDDVGTKLLSLLCNGGEPAQIETNDENAEDSNEIAEYEGIWKSIVLFEPLLPAPLPEIEMIDPVTRFFRYVGHSERFYKSNENVMQMGSYVYIFSKYSP